MNAPPTNLHGLNGRQINAIVAEVCDVSIDLFYKPGKSGQATAIARHIACYLLRQRRFLTYPQIAMMLKYADHTSALYGVNKVQWALDHNRDPIASLYAECLAAVEAKTCA